MRSIIALTILLGGCVGASAPPEAPQNEAPARPQVKAPIPETTEVALPQGHWTDWPIAPGTWVYRQDEKGAIGYFGQSGGNASVIIRCNKANQRIYISRAGAVAGPNITMRTSSISKTVQAAETGGNPPYIAAELSPTDPILDAIAYSRGRFTVEASGHPPLAIPAWAEVSRIIEDCRS
jgi:hypothetical protein